MICKACRQGLHNHPVVRFIDGMEVLQYLCKGGTWCDCQHKKEGVDANRPKPKDRDLDGRR